MSGPAEPPREAGELGGVAARARGELVRLARLCEAEERRGAALARAEARAARELGAGGAERASARPELFGAETRSPLLQAAVALCASAPRLDLVDRVLQPSPPCATRFSDPGYFRDDWLRFEQERLNRVEQRRALVAARPAAPAAALVSAAPVKRRGVLGFSFGRKSKSWAQAEGVVANSPARAATPAPVLEPGLKVLPQPPQQQQQQHPQQENQQDPQLQQMPQQPTEPSAGPLEQREAKTGLLEPVTSERRRSWAGRRAAPPRPSSSPEPEPSSEPLVAVPAASPSSEPLMPMPAASPAPAPELDPAAVKYSKMLKVGLSEGAVRQRMISDGVDPSLLFGSSAGQPAAQSRPTLKLPVSKLSAAEREAAAARSAVAAKYQRMLKMGISEGAVRQKMLQEGVDPALLEDSSPPVSPSSVPKPSRSAQQPAQELDVQRLGKYMRMLQMGLAQPAVEHAMVRDGVDSRELFAGSVAAPIAAATSSAATSTSLASATSTMSVAATSTWSAPATSSAASADPRYAKFERMLKVGLAPDAVRHALLREGLDPAVLLPGASGCTSSASAAAPAPAPVPAPAARAPPAAAPALAAAKTAAEAAAEGATQTTTTTEVPESCNALFATIRLGKTLRSAASGAESEPRPTSTREVVKQVSVPLATAAAAPMLEGRNALLDAIKQGKPLRPAAASVEAKHAVPDAIKQAPASSSPADMTDAIKQRPALRKTAHESKSAPRSNDADGGSGGRAPATGSSTSELACAIKLRPVLRSTATAAPAGTTPGNPMLAEMLCARLRKPAPRTGEVGKSAVLRHVEQGTGAGGAKLTSGAKLTGVAALLARRLEVLHDEQTRGPQGAEEGDDGGWADAKQATCTA